MVFSLPQVLLLWTAFFFLIIGLPALFAPTKFRKVLEKSLKNEDVVRTRWVITLLFGLPFLAIYQAIDVSWGLLFSLFGYACLIKGAVLTIFPSYGQRKYKMVYNTDIKVIIIGIAILVVCALLTWIALAKI